MLFTSLCHSIPQFPFQTMQLELHLWSHVFKVLASWPRALHGLKDFDALTASRATGAVDATPQSLHLDGRNAAKCLPWTCLRPSALSNGTSQKNDLFRLSSESA